MTIAEQPEWTAIILAAGEGTRMKSTRAKVLHEVAGRALVSWVIDAALAAGAKRCVVVVGHQREEVERELEAQFGNQVETAVQPEQRGTGDAVRCALEAQPGLDGRVVVLYGDCPMIPDETIRGLVADAHERGAELGLITATHPHPHGYGRILRDPDGRVTGIAEERDCTATQREITEINPGIYDIDVRFAREAIASLQPNNAQGQLYLTDLVALAAGRGPVASVPGRMEDLFGVNDPHDLAVCEARRRLQIAESLARNGVRVVDLNTLYVDADCEVEAGATLGAQVHLRGRTVVRAGASVDTGCVLRDVVVEANAAVLPYSVATDSTIGEGARLGPFSHLRPGSILGPRSKVGNFSETKKTSLGEGSKVNHLSYVGDGKIGAGVNIGAGTIFCNYDGEQKHETVIGDGVFIGSDSQLIAPLEIGRGAYVASGTTVTRDVPEDALAVSRVRQDNKKGYAAKLRARLRRKKAKDS
ncbi:MAG: bifunctional UDP-N-acetylglucosamine diphosphorylase/glucosamine-1-phosphate N-acetyltransferase GlmU [Myxococcota bacterium]